MFIGMQRKKEKKCSTSGNKEIKKDERICPDYKSRLREYRDDLWNLGRADLDCDMDDTGDGPTPDHNRNVPLRGGASTRTPNHNGECDPTLVRLSMHWEEFFGMNFYILVLNCLQYLWQKVRFTSIYNKFNFN